MVDKLVSVIIPLYNRPSEIEELLASLVGQLPIFEVIIVEDGSQIRSDEVIARYSNKLDISYIYQDNGGPGAARNRGAQEATAPWLIFLDSDTTLPEGYMAAAAQALEGDGAARTDMWGGADREMQNYTPLQRAINYSMTSPLTTGGIRGSRSGASRAADKFYPRSFNMGIRRELFNRVGGFSAMRFGEDIDLSYRVVAEGFEVRFFSQLWLFHKRRSTIQQFFKQLFNSGIARVALSVKHHGTLKFVHLLPMFFVLVATFLLLGAFWSPWSLMPFALLVLILFTDAVARTRSAHVALLAVVTTITQLKSYGFGLIVGWFNICLLRRRSYTAFTSNFYK